MESKLFDSSVEFKWFSVSIKWPQIQCCPSVIHSAVWVTLRRIILEVSGTFDNWVEWFERYLFLCVSTKVQSQKNRLIAKNIVKSTNPFFPLCGLSINNGKKNVSPRFWAGMLVFGQAWYRLECVWVLSSKFLKPTILQTSGTDSLPTGLRVEQFNFHKTTFSLIWLKSGWCQANWRRLDRQIMSRVFERIIRNPLIRSRHRTEWMDQFTQIYNGKQFQVRA